MSLSSPPRSSEVPTPCETTLLARARAAGPVGLRRMARTHDWDSTPEQVLGWIMAQKCIDLATALTVFLRGEPERFNYMPKRDVPTDFTGATRLLDNICQRVNSGFYLFYPGAQVSVRARLDTWLAYQNADRAEGRRGRWILNDAILDPLLQDHTVLDRMELMRPGNRWRDLIDPVLLSLGGGGRTLLKYRPREK